MLAVVSGRGTGAVFFGRLGLGAIGLAIWVRILLFSRGRREMRALALYLLFHQAWWCFKESRLALAARL
jgi:hypothetical protein